MSDPSFQVINTYKDYLAPLLPLQPQGNPAQITPIYYSHPGDRVMGSALVWFDDIMSTTVIHSLRATVRRRKIKTTFAMVIGCQLAGETGIEGLQYQSDQFCHSIFDLVDTDVATEEHFHSPELVDVASVLDWRMERGSTATGVGSRMTVRLSFDARFL